MRWNDDFCQNHFEKFDSFCFIVMMEAMLNLKVFVSETFSVNEEKQKY